MFQELTEWAQNNKNRIIVIVAVIIALDVFVYWQIFAAGSQNRNLRLYFLAVGQGDSEFVELPGGVKILIDGGPANGKVLEELSKILPPTERYIDLVINSHPQLDHFGGLIEILKRYRVGVFIHNGRAGTTLAFEELKKVIRESGVETINLGAGDKISYQESFINVLSPDEDLIENKELNDTALVMELNSQNIKSLFTGDISSKVENVLAQNLISKINILKVAHHGSKFSSSANFLNAVKPKLAVIEVGENSYGHPTAETLTRLDSAGIKVYRTDKSGTIKITVDENVMLVYK